MLLREYQGKTLRWSAQKRSNKAYWDFGLEFFSLLLWRGSALNSPARANLAAVVAPESFDFSPLSLNCFGKNWLEACYAGLQEIKKQSNRVKVYPHHKAEGKIRCIRSALIIQLQFEAKRPRWMKWREWDHESSPLEHQRSDINFRIGSKSELEKHD